MLDNPGLLLRIEGWMALTVSFAAYHQLSGNWLGVSLAVLPRHRTAELSSRFNSVEADQVLSLPPL